MQISPIFEKQTVSFLNFGNVIIISFHFRRCCNRVTAGTPNTINFRTFWNTNAYLELRPFPCAMAYGQFHYDFAIWSVSDNQHHWN